ncbi:MAG: hypothetical protein MR412_01520 [Firmicutes bacterium]|nr:hypothetical protein [Bacillota bacterium]
MKSYSIKKSFGYLIIKTLIPSIINLGLIAWLFWIIMVSSKANNWLTLIAILSFIIISILIGIIGNHVFYGIFSDIFISNQETELIVTKIDNGKYTIEEKTKDNSGGALLLSFLIGFFSSFIGLLLFLIGLLRVICSNNLRRVYSLKFDDFVEDFLSYKKFWIATILTTFLIICVFSLLTYNTQKNKNIDIFENFNKNQVVYSLPEIKASDYSVEPGGSYINGYIIKIYYHLEYSGDISISTISGIISMYNTTGKNLLDTNIEINNYSDGHIIIECSNSANIQELLASRKNNIKIYFNIKSVLYSNYHFEYPNANTQIY